MTTPYIDPKEIFASDAPNQDKPARFDNYTKGMDETRKNNGRPTIKQANFLQQKTDQKILYIHERGAALPYIEGFPYEENAPVVKDGVLVQKKGNEWKPVGANKASDILDESGLTQQEVNNQTIRYVASFDDLENINNTNNGDFVYVKSYYEGVGKGGAFYYFEDSKWNLYFDGEVNADMFGAIGDKATDNTDVYARMIAQLPKNTKIVFSDGHYIGNFHSNKAFDIQVNSDAVLQPKSGNNGHLLSFESGDVYETVLSKIIDRGSTSIELPLESSVSAGDLIVLWNGYLRNSDVRSPVNFETVKVKSVSNNSSSAVCLLEKPVRSRQIGGTVHIKVYRNPLKGVKVNIDGLILNNEASHFGRFIVTKGCINPIVDNCKTVGTVGHAVSFEESYGARLNYVEFNDPLAVNSGAGYGVVCWKSSECSIGKVFSTGMRHAVDFSSAYGCSYDYIKEDDAKGAPLILSHNGYCGDISGGDVDITTNTPQYLVSASSQGYFIDGAVSVERRLAHPIHDISIGNITANINCSVEENVRVLNLDTEMKGAINIGRIESIYLNKIQPSKSAMSNLLTVSGQSDSMHIESLKTNCSRHICNVRTVFGNQGISRLTIGSINTGLSDFGLYIAGYDIDVGVFDYENIDRGYCCEVVTSGGTFTTQTRHVNIAKILNISLQPLLVPSNIRLTSGSINVIPDGISTAISATDGTALTSKQIQLGAKFLLLATTISTPQKTSITMSSLPIPHFYNGAEVVISNGRPDQLDRVVVNIPKGDSSLMDIVLNSGQSVKLMSFAGKWIMV